VVSEDGKVLRLRAERLDAPAGAALVEALERELTERYGAEGADFPEVDELAPPRGSFLVAYVEDVPVGCGGVRARWPGVGELKRLYVAPAFRRRGVARRLVVELERAAIALGCRAVRLETGTLQPEAIALYGGAGYLRIPCYAPYTDDPQSLCFEKDLTGMVPAGDRPES
jgi:GNAT superfamily N-acetyltransferase